MISQDPSQDSPLNWVCWVFEKLLEKIWEICSKEEKKQRTSLTSLSGRLSDEREDARRTLRQPREGSSDALLGAGCAGSAGLCRSGSPDQREPGGRFPRGPDAAEGRSYDPAVEDHEQQTVWSVLPEQLRVLHGTLQGGTLLQHPASSLRDCEHLEIWRRHQHVYM